MFAVDAFATRALTPPNLTGSATVSLPLAISTSVDPAAASIVLANPDSEVNVTLPPLNL
jgi:hypothetical protein